MINFLIWALKVYIFLGSISLVIFWIAFLFAKNKEDFSPLELFGLSLIVFFTWWAGWYWYCDSLRYSNKDNVKNYYDDQLDGKDYDLKAIMDECP